MGVYILAGVRRTKIVYFCLFVEYNYQDIK